MSEYETYRTDSIEAKVYEYVRLFIYPSSVSTYKSTYVELLHIAQLYTDSIINNVYCNFYLLQTKYIKHS
jgi:hypothetical protein